jgi:hypothetical protein
MNNPWPYYYILEDKLLDVFKYIEPTKDNLHVHGIKNVELLMLAGVETESSFKQLIKNGQGKENIKHWLNELNKDVPRTKNVSLRVMNSDIEVTPFDGIDSIPYKPLTWWQSYNKVKHNRFANQKIATLEVAIGSMAGLYVLNVIIGSLIKTLYPATESNVFVPKDRLIINGRDGLFTKHPISKHTNDDLILDYTFWR